MGLCNGFSAARSRDESKNNESVEDAVKPAREATADVYRSHAGYAIQKTAKDGTLQHLHSSGFSPWAPAAPDPKRELLLADTDRA